MSSSSSNSKKRLIDEETFNRKMSRVAFAFKGLSDTSVYWMVTISVNGKGRRKELFESEDLAKKYRLFMTVRYGNKTGISIEKVYMNNHFEWDDTIILDAIKERDEIEKERDTLKKELENAKTTDSEK